MLFTVITVLVVQGGLAVVGSVLVQVLASPEMTNALAQNAAIIEMTAVGGILLMALGFVLLDVKKSRVANFLPALLIAPLMVVIGQALNIPIYPL